jgi:serine/threonine protein kinase
VPVAALRLQPHALSPCLRVAFVVALAEGRKVMDPDDMIGQTLGNYRVLAKLGQGGMGAVYLAEHPVLGRKAAIKVLLPELSRLKEAVSRFFDEARMTARLRHPALVDVFDFGALPDGRAFLIMEFLEGECLEARINQRGPLPVRQALAIARQIALGVSVAHAEQITHRDLKPDNIFLLPPAAGSREERVKILDFGIAKLGRAGGGSGLTREGTIIGTPPYMAPEQGRGDSEVDHRADIYSLGCILFTMLAGRPPFLSESAYEMVAMHQHEPPPTLESLRVAASARLERLLATLLEKNPAARFGSMLVVADAIGALIDSESQEAAPRTTLLLHAVSPAPGARRRSPQQNQVSAGGGPASTPAGTPSPVPGVTRVDPAAQRPSPVRNAWSTVLVAGAAAAIVVASVLAVVYRSRKAEPPPPASATAPASLPAPAAVPPVEAARTLPPTAIETPPAPARERIRRPAAVPVRSPPAPALSEKQEKEKEPEPPARPERPVYRGTQLEIEKKSPY